MFIKIMAALTDRLLFVNLAAYRLIKYRNVAMFTTGNKSHNWQQMTREQLIPGASEESHYSLESNLKIKNEIMKPNQMFNLGKYISNGIQR